MRQIKSPMHTETEISDFFTVQCASLSLCHSIIRRVDFTVGDLACRLELSRDISSRRQTRCTVTTAPDDGTRHTQLQPALSSAGTDRWVLSFRLNEASDSCGNRRAVGSRFQVLEPNAAKMRWPVDVRLTDVRLMSLVEELCILPELTVWSCLQSDWLPSADELFRSPLPTPGTLFLSTSSQLLRCSHLNVI